jgi:multidrug efflux pump subunit AcrA (membrane-fusion protein)
VETEFLIDDRPSVVQIPYEIIDRQDGRPFVYVIEDGRAFKRYVQIGEGVDRMMEVIKGLSAGETVVVDGVDDVFDGAMIWIQEP